MKWMKYESDSHAAVGVSKVLCPCIGSRIYMCDFIKAGSDQECEDAL